jgi:hypothetical protein
MSALAPRRYSWADVPVRAECLAVQELTRDLDDLRRRLMRVRQACLWDESRGVGRLVAPFAGGVQALEQLLGIAFNVFERGLEPQEVRAIAGSNAQADCLEDGVTSANRGVVQQDRP